MISLKWKNEKLCKAYPTNRVIKITVPLAVKRTFMSNSTVYLLTSKDVYLIYDDATGVSTVTMKNQPILCVLLTAQASIGVYLLVALLYAEWKHYKTPSSTSQMHAKWLRQVCLIAITFGATYLIINVVSYFTPATKRSCILRIAVQKFTYCIGMNSVYMFLWLRQKLFYSNPSLAYLYNRALRVVSWTVFAVVVTCFICQMTLTILGVFHENANESLSAGDIDCFDPEKRFWSIQITLSAVTSSLVHTSLMCLFIYPLWTHSMQRSNFFVRGHNGSFVSRSSVQNTNVVKDGDSLTKTNSLTRDSLRKIDSPKNSIKHSVKDGANGSTPTSPLNSPRKSVRETQAQKRETYVNDRLRDLIKRCVMLTGTCVATSITVTAITAVFYRGGLLAHFLYGTNMIINMLCCTGCVNRWRRTIFPFCNAKKKRKNSERTTSSRRQNFSNSSMRQFDSIV